MLWIEIEADYEKFYQKIHSNEDIKSYKAIYEGKIYYTLETTYFTDFKKDLEIRLKEEIKRIIKELLRIKKINSKAKVLLIGLGNRNIKADALGPFTIDKIIVTNHLKNSKDRPICAFNPDVMGNTGMDTAEIIKSVVKNEKPELVILIDSLKANTLSRMNTIIQITDKGVIPGSAFQNDRIEINNKYLNVPVIIIGIPTVVETDTIIREYITEDEYFESTNTIVSSKNIDVLINIMSDLLANSLNEVLLFYKK